MTWRENIERVWEALLDTSNALVAGTMTEGAFTAVGALVALTAQMEELERANNSANVCAAHIEEFAGGEGRCLVCEAEAAEKARQELEIAAGYMEEELRAVKQRVEELEGALRLVYTSEASREVHEIASAALAQSDPPEDSE